jgi:outer membrane protein TolC
MRVAIITSLLAVLSGALPALAQTPQPVLDRPVPQRLTLADALARATETSHVLGELKAREQASEAVQAQTKAETLPVIAAEGGYTRTNHVSVFGFTGADGLFRVIYPDVPDNWRTRLDMQWPIYTGGRTQALERAADAERHASGKDLAAARSDLTLETTRTFWALVTATESVRVVRESVTRVEGQLHDVKARFDAGFLPPNDVLTVETRVAREHSLLIDAENQRDSARAELARLIGAPIDASFDPDATLDVPAGQAAATTTQVLTEQAKSGRADRQALLFRTQAADERVDAARGGNKPQVALAAGYDYSRPNPNIFPRQDAWKPSWQLGFNVGWTLFNGGRTSAEIAEARSLSTAVRERLAELDTQIALEVRQRQLDLTSAISAVKPAVDAVGSATEARRVVQERFGAGVATSSDLLDAQQDQLEAELGRTRALANVKLAEARLARALGQ